MQPLLIAIRGERLRLVCHYSMTCVHCEIDAHTAMGDETSVVALGADSVGSGATLCASAGTLTIVHMPVAVIRPQLRVRKRGVRGIAAQKGIETTQLMLVALGWHAEAGRAHPLLPGNRSRMRLGSSTFPRA